MLITMVQISAPYLIPSPRHGQIIMQDLRAGSPLQNEIRTAWIGTNCRSRGGMGSSEFCTFQSQHVVWDPSEGSHEPPVSLAKHITHAALQPAICAADNTCREHKITYALP